jgi:hypothetical protein
MEENTAAIQALTDALKQALPILEQLATIFHFGVAQSKDQEQYAELQTKLGQIENKHDAKITEKLKSVKPE